MAVPGTLEDLVKGTEVFSIERKGKTLVIYVNKTANNVTSLPLRKFVLKKQILLFKLIQVANGFNT